MTQEDLAENGYSPTPFLRWREVIDLSLDRPVAAGVGWEGMRNYFVLEQKWTSEYAVRKTEQPLPDVWIEVSVGEGP